MSLVPALDARSASNDDLVTQMPHNLDAEQALLGALLFDTAAYERRGENLAATHFYEPFHARLYAAIEDHIRRGQLAEPIILLERFKRDPAFEELGGIRYLADLVDRAPPAANAAEYARAIYDLALRRDLIRIGGDIATMAGQGDAGPAPPGLLTSPAPRPGRATGAAGPPTRAGGLGGLSTGLIDLDSKIGGLHPS